jgi:hypothetical protein
MTFLFHLIGYGLSNPSAGCRRHTFAHSSANASTLAPTNTSAPDSSTEYPGTNSERRHSITNTIPYTSTNATSYSTTNATSYSSTNSATDFDLGL